MCLSDKPAAVPAAKKAAVDGKLFFVSEPQSIRVVESKYFVNQYVFIYLVQFYCRFNFGRTDLGKLDFFNSFAFILP